MKAISLIIVALLSMSDIQLENRSLFNNKIELLVPKDFFPMSKEMLELKYPQQNRPTYVLTNENGTVNIGFRQLPMAGDEKMIASYMDIIKLTFQRTFPDATWKGNGTILVDGKNMNYLKVITRAVDQKIYNYIFLTGLEGKILMGTFNCTEKLLPKWETTAEIIVRSLHIK